MNKILSVVIIVICVFSFLFSQTEPDSLWFNIYGDLSEKAQSLIQTSDNNYVFTGKSEEDGNSNVYLVKTDEDGNELWSKTYDRSNSDYGYSVFETSDNGLIIAGQTKSQNFDNMDIYLIRTDSIGDTLWTKNYEIFLYEFGRSVIQTDDEGFLITGWGHTSDFNSKMIILKVDESGNILWSNSFGREYGCSGRSLKQTFDGGFVISGHIGTSIGSADLFLVKTDANGDSIWTKNFNEPGQNVACWGNDIHQTDDNGFIIAGEVEYNVDDSDIFLVKTDEYGNTMWTKTFGGILDCGAESIEQTNDGGYILSGWKHEIGSGHNDIYILKTDSNGDSLWSKSFGGNFNDKAFDLIENIEGDFIITGYTYSYPSTGNNNAFLLKLGYETGIENVINSSLYSSTNYPNPFNPSTTIKFSIPNNSKVELSIFNTKGQFIKSLINETLFTGEYSVTWYGVNDSGKPVGSGVYLYQIKTPTKISTKKMLLLK